MPRTPDAAQIALDNLAGVPIFLRWKLEPNQKGAQTKVPYCARRDAQASHTRPRDWGTLAELPCELTLELPLPAFTVRDLLRLQAQSVVDTKWGQTTDIPLRANGELIAWTEFEVVGEKLAVRLTELA